MFVGWLSVSFGNIESSAKKWDELPREEPEVDEVVVWARSSSMREVSPSTKWRESMSDIGSASGVTVLTYIVLNYIQH